jgi:hypothetical protein
MAEATKRSVSEFSPKKETKEKVFEEEEKKQEVQRELPKKKKKVSEKQLPVWNFPLKGRSVKARNLAEAEKKINTQE